MDFDRIIMEQELKYLALRKLAEDGLALCQKQRLQFRADGLTTPSKSEMKERAKEEEKRVAEQRITQMLLRRNQLKKEKELRKHA